MGNWLRLNHRLLPSSWLVRIVTEVILYIHEGIKNLLIEIWANNVHILNVFLALLTHINKS